MAERPFQPVPNTPLVADPTGDAIWKRWLQGLQQFLGNAVRGPGSSTDNAVARWDGTTGTFLNNSGVIIDDSNNVSGIVNLTTTGSTILGDAAADTLTINTGTWTLGNKFTATYAAGSLPAGSSQLNVFDITSSGHSGGTTSLFSSWRFRNLFGGSNNAAFLVSLNGILEIADSANVTNAIGFSPQIYHGGTGTITNAFPNYSIINVANTGSITNAAMFIARPVAFTSTGTVSLLRGFYCPNLGDSKVTTAYGLQVEDFSGSTTMTAVKLELSAGTGKKNLNITGTAENYLAGDLTCDANVTLGNASADTLTINAGTWTLGNNFIATRAAGTLAAGATSLCDFQSTFTGDAGGTTIARPWAFTAVLQGANNVDRTNALTQTVNHSGSGTLTLARSINNNVIVSSTGTITTAHGVESVFSLTSSGNITTAANYYAETPAFSSTGAITTLYGFQSNIAGNAKITNAIAFYARDMSASTVMTGMELALSAGTGKTNLNITGTADNKLAGPLYLAQDNKTQQTAAAIYAGTGAPNNANGNNGDFYMRADGTVATNNVMYHKEAGAWVAFTTT